MDNTLTIGRPTVEETAETLTLRANVSFRGRKDTCFYSVPKEYAGFADRESSNCFLVGLLYPAMRHGEDIVVEGTVSEKLLYNINEYLIPLMALCDDRLKRITVKAGSTNASYRTEAKAIGTGFPQASTLLSPYTSTSCVRPPRVSS